MLVCLHGWGGSKESFEDLRRALAGSSITILTPDLPGFGEEPDPQMPWTPDDYADWVVDWVGRNAPQANDRTLWLLGHSYGGRIAIKLAARACDPKNTRPAFPIDRLFLCAASGIRHPRHIKRIIGLTLAKAGKFFLSIPGLNVLAPVGKKLLYKLVRVHDYEKASPVMRQTLINSSAEDLRSVLPCITVPTAIFWGTDDGMNPLSDGKHMAAQIPHAELHTYEGVRHRVHRDKAKEIAETIIAAIKAQTSA